MRGPSFNDFLRAIIATMLGAWRPCQPLLLMAVVVALVVAAVFGLLAPGEVGQSLAGLPLTVLTLAVSAGVAGYIITGQARFTRLEGALREPRSYRFVLRYLLLSLGLSLPLVAMIPTLAGAAAGGDALGSGTALTALALIGVVIFLAARLAPFPYTVFMASPASLADTWRMTEGHALKIIGCIALFAVAILGLVTAVTFVLGGLIAATGSATGFGGGAAATMAVQAIGQIAAVYAIDCVYGTITRMLTATPRDPVAGPDV